MLEALAAACPAPAPCLGFSGSSVAAQDAETTGLGNMSNCSAAWPLGALGPVHGQISTVAPAGLDPATQSGQIQWNTPGHSALSGGTGSLQAVPGHSGLSGGAGSLQAAPGCYGAGLPTQCAVPGLLPNLSAAMHGAATPPWPSTPGRSGQSQFIPAHPAQQHCAFAETSWWSQGQAPAVPGILTPTGLSVSAPCWQQPQSPASLLIPLAPSLAAPPFTSSAHMAAVPASVPTQLGQVDVRSAFLQQQQQQQQEQQDVAALHLPTVPHVPSAFGTAVGVAATEPATAASPGRPREPTASSGALAMAAMAGEAFMEVAGGSPSTTTAKAPLSLTQTVFHFRSPS